MVKYVTITPNEEGQRLDNFLMRHLKGVPKSHVYRIIREGQVRLNKKRVQPTTRLALADEVRIPPVRLGLEKPLPVNPSLATFLLDCILYEDSDLIVINKPAGVAVHGGSGISFGVIEALRSQRQDLFYIELAHRLDKDTSGCLILAKKRATLIALHALFTARQVEKRYLALLQGEWMGKKTREVTAPLCKQTLASGERFVRIDEENGKPAKTRFRLLASTPAYCLVSATPYTGRTHQIRVHSAYLGHAIVGDVKYQGEPSERLYLHAWSIQFTLKGKHYYFEAPVEARFLDKLRQLGWEQALVSGHHL